MANGCQQDKSATTANEVARFIESLGTAIIFIGAFLVSISK